jgi:hypothetical protein
MGSFRCSLRCPGIAMTIYLTRFMTQPPEALRAAFASIMAGK